MNDFDGKVVLITGAGRAIGQAIVDAFSARRAILAINDINPLNLERMVAQVLASGGQARDYVFDVAKRMPVQALVNQVLEDWGRIDILVNSASVMPRAAILDMDEWEWHRTLDVNLGGAFFAMQQVGRVMSERGGGTIINLAFAGRVLGQKGLAAFVASKAGLVALTREAAREFAPYHIRVNAICPGLIAVDELLNQPAPQQWLEDAPLAWNGTPEDVARLVLFLCSDAAAHLTGQAISLDSGLAVC